MHRSKTALMRVAFVMFGLSQLSLGAVLPQVSSSDNEFTQVVRLLWSPDLPTREVAKEKLFRLGDASVTPLIDLLRRLIDTQEPQFETGREEEGKRFLADHYKKKGSDAAEIERIVTIEISWRIKKDVVDVLTWLEAREAVPVLISSLDSGIRSGSSTSLHRSAEIEMLIKFGSMAVPDLDQAIETVESDVAAMPDNPGWTREQNRLFKVGEIQTRQAKLAFIIGEIGDGRSLPVLERLLPQSQQRGDRGFTIIHIKKAIAKIRDRQK